MLEDLIARQEAFFRTIVTMECDGTYDVKVSDALRRETRGDMNDFSSKIHFISDGGKYRSEVASYDADNRITFSVINAYNGKLYQRMQLGKRVVLDVSQTSHTESPYGTMHPLLLAYGWAFTKGDVVSIDALRQSETWSTLAERTITIEHTTRDGIECIAWTLRGREQPNGGYDTRRVYFAVDSGYLPCEFTIHDSENRLRSHCTVAKFTRSVNEGAEVVFPLQMLVSTFYGPDATAELTTVAAVDGQTLRINHPISDGSLFTLPVSQADVYTDLDVDVGWETPRAELLGKPGDLLDGDIAHAKPSVSVKTSGPPAMTNSVPDRGVHESKLSRKAAYWLIAIPVVVLGVIGLIRWRRSAKTAGG